MFRQPTNLYYELNDDCDRKQYLIAIERLFKIIDS